MNDTICLEPEYHRGKFRIFLTFKISAMFEPETRFIVYKDHVLSLYTHLRLKCTEISLKFLFHFIISMLSDGNALSDPIQSLGFPTKIAKLDFRENFRLFSKKNFAIFKPFSRKFSTPFSRKFSRKQGQYFRENRSTSKSVNLVISTINKLG